MLRGKEHLVSWHFGGAAAQRVSDTTAPALCEDSGSTPRYCTCSLARSLTAKELLCHVAEPDTACLALMRLEGRPLRSHASAGRAPGSVLLPCVGVQHVVTLWTFRKQVSNR